jgi:hypothetical protein
MTHYQLIFVTSNGARRSLRVSNVDPVISPQDLQAAVDAFNAFAGVFSCIVCFFVIQSDHATPDGMMEGIICTG